MREQPKRRPGELVFALVLVIFATAAFWQAHAISGFTGKTTPGVFPMLASGTMLISGLVILISTARLPPPDAGDKPIARRFFTEILPPRHLALVALVALYVIAMPYLGFLIASALFLGMSLQLLWRRSPLVTLAITALALLAIHLVFREVFQVILPQGSLLRGLW